MDHQLLHPSEMRLRSQTRPLWMFDRCKYRVLADWWRLPTHPKLIQHKRSGAVWMIENGTATVVYPNKTLKALLNLLERTHTPIKDFGYA